MSGIHRSSSAALKNGLPPQELLDDLCGFDVLKPYVSHLDDIFKDFTSYKVRVLVIGAIILDETYERCVLVKGWKGSSWSFPRGKKNKDEEDHACAIREVLEETGFDVSKFLNKDEYIESIFGQQRVRLYIIAGVKDDTSFAPLTKKVISEIAWQRLDELQPANDNVISRGITGLKLYMVAPFLASLKSWISTHQPPIAPKPDIPLKGDVIVFLCAFADDEHVMNFVQEFVSGKQRTVKLGIAAVAQ
ncbi:hypothetical protein SO802_016630 [Lithocarpus litseifolius]|uniref:Nudix hydrolase domain-containing protein n=1 Tax=Lithocarpus litseifolius TaxID=425828 RepID=A0AAW2CXP5_9ROSI